ncbi:MAG: hypothetical protein DMF68_10275 [Acidobacteria bacterium]|nr:MAG: hypothetical protein DMF68_10275 [Acidobacteriota bacterium]
MPSSLCASLSGLLLLSRDGRFELSCPPFLLRPPSDPFEFPSLGPRSTPVGKPVSLRPGPPIPGPPPPGPPPG